MANSRVNSKWKSLLLNSGLALAGSACVDMAALVPKDSFLSSFSPSEYLGCTSGTIESPVSVSIGFDFPDDASKIRIYRDRQLVYTAESKNFNTFTDTGLTTGQRYEYSCEASTESGTIVGSITQSLTPQMSFRFNGAKSAVNLNDKQIRISWDAAAGTGVKNYVVYRVTDGGASLSSLRTVDPSINQITINNLTPGTLYTFRVRAFDLKGFSDPNLADVSAFTFAGASTVGQKDTSTVRVNFPIANEADAVNVYCKIDGGTYGAAPTGRADPLEGSIDLSGPGAGGGGSWIPGISYICKAKALFGQSEDQNTVEKTFTFSSSDPFVTGNYTGCYIATSPDPSDSSLFSKATGPTTATIRFEFPSTAARVNVYRNGTLIGFSADRSQPLFNDSSLTNGTAYSYSCEAVSFSDSKLMGSQSAAITPSLDLGFAGATRAYNNDGTSVTVEWSQATSPSVANYVVYQSTNMGNSLTYLRTVAADKTSVRIYNLTPGTLYYFRVRAFDSSGNAELNAIDRPAFTYGGLSSYAITGSTSAVLSFPAATEAESLTLKCLATPNATSSDATTIWNSGTAILQYSAENDDLGSLTSAAYSSFPAGVQQGCILRASAPGVPADSNTKVLSFTPVGVATAIAFENSSLQQVLAGSPFPVPLKLVLRDTTGNITVAGPDANAEIQLTIAPNTGVLRNASGVQVTKVNAVNGVADLRAVGLNIREAGSYTITAAKADTTSVIVSGMSGSPAITSNPSNSFSVLAGEPAAKLFDGITPASMITISPASLSVGQTANISLVLKDRYGNASGNFLPSITASSLDTIPEPNPSDSSGNTSTTFRSLKSGPRLVSVTNVTGLTASLTLSPLGPDHVYFKTPTLEATAGNYINRLSGGFVVEVHDTYDNPVSQPGTVNLAFATGGDPSNGLARITGNSVTSTNGTVTFTATKIDKPFADYRLRAYFTYNDAYGSPTSINGRLNSDDVSGSSNVSSAFEVLPASSADSLQFTDADEIITESIDRAAGSSGAQGCTNGVYVQSWYQSFYPRSVDASLGDVRIGIKISNEGGPSPGVLYSDSGCTAPLIKNGNGYYLLTIWNNAAGNPDSMAAPGLAGAAPAPFYFRSSFAGDEILTACVIDTTTNRCMDGASLRSVSLTAKLQMPDPTKSSISYLGTGAIVADGVATASIRVLLRDASGSPVIGATPSIGAINGVINSPLFGTEASSNAGSCSPTDSSGYALCSLSSKKAEIKKLIVKQIQLKGLPAETRVNFSITGSEVTFSAGGVNLEVPIDMIDAAIGSYITGSASTILSPLTNASRFLYTDSEYDGTKSFTFSVRASNANTSSDYNIYLKRTASPTDATIATITVPMNSNVATYSVSFSTPLTGQYYIDTDLTPAANDLKIFAARFIVNQKGATKTRLYFPLVSGSSASISINGAGSRFPYAISTSTTTNVCTSDQTILFQKRKAAFDLDGAITGLPSCSGNCWRLESSYFTQQGTYWTTVGLYNLTTISSPVAITTAQTTPATVQLSTNSANLVYGRFDFSDSANNFTEGSRVGICFYTTGRYNPAIISRAQLSVALTNLTMGEVYSRVAKYISTSLSFSQPTSQAQFIDWGTVNDPTYSNGKLFLEATGRFTGATGSSGTIALDYWKNSTNAWSPYLLAPLATQQIALPSSKGIARTQANLGIQFGLGEQIYIPELTSANATAGVFMVYPFSQD